MNFGYQHLNLAFRNAATLNLPSSLDVPGKGGLFSGVILVLTVIEQRIIIVFDGDFGFTERMKRVSPPRAKGTKHRSKFPRVVS
jgi:hypothetical protein